MQDACARLKWGAIESHRMAQHDATLTERRGQRFVGVAPSAGIRTWVGTTGIPVTIGFGEDHVERDDRCAHVPHTSDKVANEVTPPGPLTDRCQAAFIHIDDDDAAIGRLRTSRSKQDVVRRVVQSSEKRGWNTASYGGDDHCTETHRNTRRRRVGRAFENLATSCGLLTAISTRDCAVGVSSAVLTSGSSSPTDVTSMAEP